MKYKKVQYPRATDTSVVRVRPPVPSDCIALYRTSLNFDITSANDNDRCEYWSSNSGTLDQSAVEGEIYGGKSELEVIGFKTLTIDESIGFGSIVCDMLEVSINNLSDQIKIVTMQASNSSQVLETITLGIGQIATITVPKPFDRYKLACPANTFVKLNQYVL